MTNEEFQTATDLQRVRLIKAELDALEASSNVAEAGPISATAMSNVRLVMREWERVLVNSVSIRKSRAKGIDNGE